MKRFAIVWFSVSAALGQIPITVRWDQTSGPPMWNQWTRIAYDPYTQRTLMPLMDASTGHYNLAQAIYSNAVFKWNSTAGTITETGYSAVSLCSDSSPTWPIPHHVYGTPVVDTLRHVYWWGPGPCANPAGPVTGWWWTDTTTASSWTLGVTTTANNGDSQSSVYDPVDDARFAVERTGPNSTTVTRVYCSTMPVGGGTPTGTLSAQQTARGVCTQADNWVTVTTNTAPAGSVFPAFVWDMVTGKAYLYGGFDNHGPSGPQTETWSFAPESATWTNLAPAHNPGAQSPDSGFVGWAAAMAQGQLWYANPGSPAAIWAYTPGGDWVQQSLSGDTLKRNPVSMAYDESTSRLVMWVGESGPWGWIYEAQLPVDARSLVTSGVTRLTGSVH